MAVPPPVLDGLDRHQDYWFESGDLVLLVDEVYFKVHRELLARASGVIKDMLSMPVSEEPSQAEGNNVDNAILIPDVPYQHFEAVLQAAYGHFIPPDLTPKMHIALDTTDSPENPRDPTCVDAVDLLRVAHRLQVPGIVVPLAQVALPHLHPVERFILCHDLGLDEIRSTYEQDLRVERLRIDCASRIRNEQRGMRCHWTSVYANEPPEACDSIWLVEAFTALVLAYYVKMPSPELGDRTSLYVMIARQRLAELRTASVSKWINSRAAYKAVDVLCASNLWRISKQNIGDYNPTVPPEFQFATMTTIQNALPSDEEECAVIRSYWETAGP